MNNLFLVKLRYVLVIASFLVSSNSFAQGVLEEVVVTATKRVESIQDVPVSVSAVSGEQLQDLGIIDMKGLSLYVPNFEINDASIIPNLYVRGLGGGLTHSIEQSVGRFIDDVYIGRAAINTHGFMDVAGVEVLRGPQGTLFGKNTVAGAMIVRTGDPTDEYEAGINLSAGDYETTGGSQEVQGYVSGPISDELSGRIAARYRHKNGYYINRLEGPNGDQREDIGLRGKLRWTPNDQFTANLKLEWQTYDTDGADTGELPSWTPDPVNLSHIRRFSPNITPVLDWVIDVDCTDKFIDTNQGDGEVMDDVNAGSFCPSRRSETYNATLKMDYDIDAGTFTSISAYQEYSYFHRFVALDQGPSGAFRARRDEEFSGFSQEFRFTSTENDTFDYILGLYYEDSDIARDQGSDFNLSQLFHGTGMGMVVTGRNENWIQDTESFAAFGQLRWHFNDQVSLIGGVRYTSEDKNFAFERFFREYQSETIRGPGPNLGGPPIAVSDSRSEDKVTFSITGQWHATDDVMLYATFAQGHKTGGFSDRIDSPTAVFEFDSETNDTFEVGAKTSWLDGALAFNLTYFHMSIEGLQASTSRIDPVSGVGVFSVDNAAEVTSQGIEMDLAWNVNEWLTVGGNFAWTDAVFDSFPGAENIGPGLCPTGAVLLADGSCNLAGFQLTFAPKYKGSVYADVYVDNAFGDWDVVLHGDINYSDETSTDLSYYPFELSPEHTIYNANIRFVSPNQKYSIAFLAKNISNKGYCTWCLDDGPATMNAPRELSVNFQARFD